ncbi:Splicing factor 3B subunit 4 [Orobanche gracilis]
MTTRIAPGVGANLLGQHAAERNQDATVYVGNLEPKLATNDSVVKVERVGFVSYIALGNTTCNIYPLASEEILWELFVQAGPVVNVYVPKDRVTNAHQGYGFVEFRSEEDADYAIKILNMLKLYGKAIRVNKASQDKKSVDVGANLFIGNLDPDVDEKTLYDTFSAFGVIVTNPKIMRDPETGNSRGFGFISYDSFDASDAAIENMNGQYLSYRQITVSYAYKKDTKGERHGTPAERVLAASNPTIQRSRPHTMFASGPPTLPQQNGPVPTPVAPTSFINGTIPPPAPIPALRPPPPPTQNVYQPMQQMPSNSWQGGLPQMQQQFRGMAPPPPPQHINPGLVRPPPPPAGISAPPPVWRPPPPPQQIHSMQHMSMPQSMHIPPPPQ